MAQRDHEGADDAVRLLIGKLESVRRACADSSEDDRRKAFRKALDEELRAIPENAQPAVVAAVRDGLVQDARAREERVQALEGELAQLRSSLASLKQENEPLRGGAAPVAGGGDESGLAKLRDGLLMLTENRQLSPESIELPPAYARLFRLIHELFQFAIGYEMGVNLLLAEFSIGPAADMDTKMMSGFKQIVRARFRACLEDKEGSLAALKEILTRNSRFVVDLNRAYASSLYPGTQALLSEMQPQPILDKNKRMIGFDYEQAWNTFARFHNDLAGLSQGELWERFFSASFQESLASYLDKGK